MLAVPRAVKRSEDTKTELWSKDKMFGATFVSTIVGLLMKVKSPAAFSQRIDTW